MPKNKKYWHKLSAASHRKIMKSNITIGEIMKKYSQPPWCIYQNALGGWVGCWSLVGAEQKIKSVKDCKTCSLSRRYDVKK
jgi:hypothetical protein